jgi:hypothetical protein
MTWFKVDDGFHDHPKTEELPDSAVALWTRAGSWCARHLTDGFVPERRARRLCDNPDEGIAALLAANLWIKVDGGYQFHDWGSYQPTRVEKEAERKAGADRQARWRERHRAERETAGERRDKRGPNAADNGHHDAVSNAVTDTSGDGTRNTYPDPTRPDPVVPSELPELQAPQAAPPPRTKGRRGTRLPENWSRSDEGRRAIAWAHENYPDVDLTEEGMKFTNYWLAKAGRDAVKVDWPRTFQNWIIEAARRAGARLPAARNDQGRAATDLGRRPQSPADQRVQDGAALHAVYVERERQAAERRAAVGQVGQR